MHTVRPYIVLRNGCGQRTKNFGGKRAKEGDRSFYKRKMSSRHVITNVADDTSRDDLALFDDDDPFNLPPPLPPLSPQREEDGTNQDGETVQGGQDAGDGDKKESNKKRKVKRSPRPKLDEVR